MPQSNDPPDGARAPEDAFRRLVESAPDAVVISRNAVVLYANPAAVVLLGYENAAELVGQSMATFLDQAALVTMRNRLQKMAETGETFGAREYTAARRDGTNVTVEITSIFIDFEGAPAVLAFARDVTERSRLRAQLAHADRLASLGMMAAGVAHEINNPLAFVMLAADMLERDPVVLAGGERTGELVRNIRTGVKRIATIVRDLRTYGQYEDEPPRAVDLGMVFDSAVAITAHEVRSRARLRREYEALPAVLGVPMRLEQVFVNLLLNAAHAIPEGRTNGEIAISAHSSGPNVVIEVTDNGSGIPAEVLPRIFEPFVTTKPLGAGVGLGLSICRDIVVRWGGRIDASSTEGSGTTLRVTLPLATESRPVDSKAPLARSIVATHPPSARPVSGARRRILVIDDEPLTVAMATAVLRESHDVVGETDPAAALDRLLGDGTFDVIVCDLMMPGLTGMDIYERIARERPGLEQQFVFLTGGAYTERARTFLASITNRRLMKPLSTANLESLLAAS